MTVPYVNKDLFSKRFLDHLIRLRPDWAASEEAARSAREKLRALYAAQKPILSRMKEPQLEQRWIRPVLDVLGVVYEVQPSLPTDDPRVTLSPDYAFFANTEARHAAMEARARGQAASSFKKVCMLGDAKRWGIDFGGAPRGERTPRQQLNQYLHLSGVDWGFLTDGMHWRLVHRSVAGRLDHYYQVNLIAALQSESLDDFRYFYLFFRGESLASSDLRPSFLDSARRESQDYAESVGRDLKRAIYDALWLLARAFLCRIPRDHALSPDLVYRECLTLLYRLLFLLYAEHRRLLPLDSPSYFQCYSLTRLSRQLAEQIDATLLSSSQATALYGQLQATFRMVDRGDQDLGVPPYNGGLFSDKEHPFLSEFLPGDRDLAAVIDLLARTPMRSAQKHFIDYRDLDIRHLGTIYEGLLEYRLKIAEVDLAVVGKGDEERYEPFGPTHQSLPEDRIIHRGEPYLLTDKGERWVTGSYYTPDFIVEHIVEESLGPLLQGRSPEQILELRVLDPAMGSGHFLLEVVDFLARAYGQARIDAGEDHDGVLSDEELCEYRRLVAEHCIYGVDINPMAVELAKLALWLKTMARDQPLTFLNNHLKWGDSLLSARVEQIGGPQDTRPGKKANAAQLNLFENIFLGRLPGMLKQVLAILSRHSRSREDIEYKELWDAALEQARRPFQIIADLYISQLGRPMTAEFENLLLLLYRENELYAHPSAQEAARQRAVRPFVHFELAFPEVFYDPRAYRRPDAGFDAVIGNPPWIRQENLSADKARLKALYPSVFHPSADIYVFLVAAGLQLLREGGRLGFLLPNKWLRADYGAALRQSLTKHYRPLSLTDFGHAPIFPDADTFPCVLIVETGPVMEKDRQHRLSCCDVPREALPELQLGPYVAQNAYPVAREMLRKEGWYPLPPEQAQILKKIWKAGKPLKEHVGSRPIWGLKTGFNEAFLIDQETRERLVLEDPRCTEVLRKCLRGRDVERWHPRWAGQWMIALQSSDDHPWPWAGLGAEQAEGVFRQKYPSIYRHMKGHEAALRRRQDQGHNWWELRPSDHYGKLSEPKLLYQEIQFHSAFAMDLDGLYVNNLIHILPRADFGLLTVLNSSLMWWYLWKTAPHKKTETFALAAYYMEALPIVEAPVDGAEELVRVTRERQALEDEFLSWLRVEFEVNKPGKKLESFWALDEERFLREIKKLVEPGPSALTRLRGAFNKARGEILPLVSRSRLLEQEQHELVMRLYGLSQREREILRAGAPPRDPMTLHAGGT